MIRWNCLSCSKPLEANDLDAGINARCNGCGAWAPIPSLDVESIAVGDPPPYTHPTRPMPVAAYAPDFRDSNENRPSKGEPEGTDEAKSPERGTRRNPMIRWNCPSCAKTLKANPPGAGKRARCPQCAAVVPIPGVANTKTAATGAGHFDVELVPVPTGAMHAGLPLNSHGPPVAVSVSPPITFRCPHCQAIQAIAQHFAGQITTCSQCSLRLHLTVPRSLPVENAPPTPSPRASVWSQPLDTFDFDDQREPMPAVAYESGRRSGNRSVGSVGSVFSFSMIIIAVSMVIIAGCVAGFYMHTQSSEDAKMLEARVEWTILINRKFAINREVIFGCWRGSSFVKKLVAEQRRIDQEFDNYDHEMQARWGSKLKTLGKLSQKKGRQADAFWDRTKLEVAGIIKECDLHFLQEYSEAGDKMRDDVVRSRPIEVGKIFDRMTHTGQVQSQEQDIRLAAKDAVVQAQRNVAITEGNIQLRDEIGSKWAKKAHEDIQKKLATLEAEFVAK